MITSAEQRIFITFAPLQEVGKVTPLAGIDIYNHTTFIGLTTDENNYTQWDTGFYIIMGKVASL